MAVLVAYDGSAPAQQALEHALEEYDPEEVVLLGVIEAAEGYVGASVNLARQALKERREETARELSETVRELLEDGHEVQIETAVGDPARQIVEVAEELDVEEIIVGNHGRQGISRVLLGSVAERVVRRAPMPVTVVR